MQVIREKLNHKLELTDDTTAVAGVPQTPDDDADDPMDNVDGLPGTQAKTARALNVDVPLRPPCVATDDDGTVVPTAASRQAKQR